jgi:hypothetical protein
MSLPPRAFHPLQEVAIRWSVKPIDIVGWAIDGRIALSAALPLVETKQNRPVEGLVEICGQDVFDLFGAEANRKACVRIQRFRRRSGGRWERIITPADGVLLKPSGVVITRGEIERFEREYLPSGYRLEASEEHRPAILGEPIRVGRAGAPPRYDWDAFTGAVARRVHDEGIPASQGELIRDMLDWFATTFGVVPDESTVRRRVQGLWPVLTKRA